MCKECKKLKESLCGCGCCCIAMCKKSLKDCKSKSTEYVTITGWNHVKDRSYIGEMMRVLCRCDGFTYVEIHCKHGSSSHKRAFIDGEVSFRPVSTCFALRVINKED